MLFLIVPKTENKFNRLKLTIKNTTWKTFIYTIHESKVNYLLVNYKYKCREVIISAASVFNKFYSAKPNPMSLPPQLLSSKSGSAPKKIAIA